jgi:phage terminase Nu1 subunit (DNA packaging protein)
MGTKKTHRISEAEIGLSEVSDLTGKPVQTVHDWTKAGLKSRKTGRNRVIRVADLVRYLAAREYQPGSQRDRLAKEQADKFAIENAVKRGELVFVSQVSEVMATLAADLSSRHDAVPGRVASELAGINEPAVIRERLLDELRSVRAAFADAIAKLADALGTAADTGGDREAAEEEVGGPVGRRVPRAAPRKRRARAVAKR